MSKLFGGLSSPTISVLKLDEIKPDPNQPRKHFDKAALKELSETIRQRGLIQPIIVRTDPDGGYIIIAGERRYRAVQLLEQDTIEVVVRDDLDVSTASIIENIQRVNLTPVEEAEAIARLIEDKKLSQGDVGTLIGRSRVAINRLLKLRDLPDEIKGESIKRDVSKSILVELAQLSDEKTIKRLWEKSKKEALSIAEIRAVKNARDAAGAETPPTPNQAFSRAFGSIEMLKKASLTKEDIERLHQLRARVDQLITAVSDGE